MFSKKIHQPLPKDLQKIILQYLSASESERDIPLYCTKLIAGLLVMIPLFNAALEKNLQPNPNALKISGYLALTFIGTLITIPSAFITLPIDGVTEAVKQIKVKKEDDWARFFVDVDNPPNSNLGSPYSFSK